MTPLADNNHPDKTSERSTSFDAEQQDDDNSFASIESNDNQSNSTGLPQEYGNKRSTDGDNEDKTDVISVAKKGMVAVTFSKITVYIVLILAAFTIGKTTWLVTKQDEESTFENEFKLFANDLIKASEANARAMFGAANGLSISITSYTQGLGATWPFVYIPDWERRSNQARDSTGLELLTFHPQVSLDEQDAYNAYVDNDLDWLYKGLDIQGRTSLIPKENITQTIHQVGRNFTEPFIDDYYLPLRHMGPAPDVPTFINLDILAYETFRHTYRMVRETRKAILSEILSIESFYRYSYSWYNESLTSEYWDAQDAKMGKTPKRDRVRYESNAHGGSKEAEESEPHSYIIQPVFEDFEEDSKIVGTVLGIIPWRFYLQDLLPEGINGFQVVIKDNCGSEISYEINGEYVVFLGEGDFHDKTFDYVKVSYPFQNFRAMKDAQQDDDGFVEAVANAKDTQSGNSTDPDDKGNHQCQYFIDVYPTERFKATYTSNTPAVYTSVVVCVFVFTAIIFVIYDILVTRRQDVVLLSAARTQAVVSSLFPKSVQQRILQEADDQVANIANGNNRYGFRAKTQLKEFLEDGGNREAANTSHFGSSPIADLFPECTVLFADISGFTAWSSTREPSQVFTLLETIYHEFDNIAKRRRVFKVETVGDCYVAVAGLPEPRRDHAVVMARFATDCLQRMDSLTKRLEVSLGPDTTELSMRFGLHSGPVTAGVLRGERARFQLFGDTVNTASRMESTGKRDCIQISQETADLLVASGKQHWTVPRKDKVQAKGKGELQTYWLDIGSDQYKSAPSVVSSSDSKNARGPNNDSSNMFSASGTSTMFEIAVSEQVDPIVETKTLEAKQQRLIDWNTALLMKQLRLIIAQRENMNTQPDSAAKLRQAELRKGSDNRTVLDEVVEIVSLPQFDEHACVGNKNPDTMEIDSQIEVQLRDYVQTIAAMYRDNPFHNFEHASHVTMSTVKLLSRIVAPDLDKLGGNDTLKCLHDHTYGITSDPLTQFSVILSALVHDVDHKGIPNTTLIKEKASIATVYKGKSIAEQNSVDIAWDLLLDETYENLRRAIYQTTLEYGRFRQLVVNSVLATDIMDKELGAKRKERWNKAFADETKHGEMGQKLVNRKATIVIEHLIQASDVAHTMQHWHIYTKWNERLFEEMYVAYKDGRADVNPADSWYQGEIGFFDFYIIPLAMKLRSCGVFGVSSDEYLSYAHQNRHEWELKGQERVASMLKKYESKYRVGK